MQIKHMLHYSTPAHIHYIEKNEAVNRGNSKVRRFSLYFPYKLCRQYSVAHLVLINHDI